jgi:glycylpeptide N-tetradecanoyltransferase
MSSDQSKDVIDKTLDQEQGLDDESDGSEVEEVSTTTANPTTSSSSKKKKKKRSRIAKLLKSGSNAALVDTVMDKVKAEHSDIDQAAIRSALEQLNLKDVIAGKAGLGGKGRKDAGSHKVCLNLSIKRYLELF